METRKETWAPASDPNAFIIAACSHLEEVPPITRLSPPDRSTSDVDIEALGRNGTIEEDQIPTTPPPPLRHAAPATPSLASLCVSEMSRSPIITPSFPTPTSFFSSPSFDLPATPEYLAMMRKKSSKRLLSPAPSPEKPAEKRRTRSSARQEVPNPPQPLVAHSTSFESLDEILMDLAEEEILGMLEPPDPPRIIVPPSPAATEPQHESTTFSSDLAECSKRWKDRKELEGYAGLQASISQFRSTGPHKVSVNVQCEDIDGRENNLELNMIFEDIETYPTSYCLDSSATGKQPKRIQNILDRFFNVYGLTLKELIPRIVAALQGDDEANGGRSSFAQGESQDQDMEDEEDLGEAMFEEGGAWADPAAASAGGGGGSIDRKLLREHLLQAKEMGYRPGFSAYSDSWIISYSVPLTNLPIDPNTLAHWDDGLVEAWRQGKRLTLLVGIDRYPMKTDKFRYWLAFLDNYKPTQQELIEIIRNGQHTFYLSEALLNHLKSFPRCYQLRCGWGMNWESADRIGLCEQKSKEVFKDNLFPSMTGTGEVDDPVGRGWEANVPLCAFHWVIRRFMEAPKYCQNCGLEVPVACARPYVCEKELCLYAFMSLGLGPPVEHVIKSHPSVVDMLLSFAYTSSSGTTRMDMPTGLCIELPPEYSASEAKLFDNIADATQQRAAITYLISRIPRVSTIKAHLEKGGTLHTLGIPAGSIGILRWVVGSCRAYLKEVKHGEGLQNTAGGAGGMYGGAPSSFKQFLFVLGSPEQEVAFKEEVHLAQQKDANIATHPSMLVFHGSATERWHNILRTGLDYNEAPNGRAYGNGVYFAHEASTSLSGYSRSSGVSRPNADYAVSKAAAVVELVNVPHTFVSSSPYYVVANTKQIKPFLLIVEGAETREIESAAANEEVKASKGELFKHDPKLKMQPQFYHKPLEVEIPEKLIPSILIDDEEDDADDAALFAAPPPPPAPIIRFTPSPKSRFDKLEIMPPPVGNSIVATRALAKEFKAIIKAQDEGGLPFHVDPERENLYAWVIEMWEFGESKFKDDLKTKGVNSVVAEMRFPASFPYTPPFMRILHPRCLPFAQGGGGNITAGGSVCNEILTMTGWNPAFTIEALVRDIMVNMTEATPPARLDTRNWNNGYGMREAVDAYKRVAQQHGWEVPKDFDKLS